MQRGHLAAAEALYLAFDDPDAALHMWHAQARYDEAVDLVARVRPVSACRLASAREGVATLARHPGCHAMCRPCS